MRTTGQAPLPLITLDQGLGLYTWEYVEEPEVRMVRPLDETLSGVSVILSSEG